MLDILHGVQIGTLSVPLRGCATHTYMNDYNLLARESKPGSDSRDLNQASSAVSRNSLYVNSYMAEHLVTLSKKLNKALNIIQLYYVHVFHVLFYLLFRRHSRHNHCCRVVFY